VSVVAGTDRDDAPLSEFGVDSMKTVELMLAIETAFDLTFPEESLTISTFRSLDSIASVVSELVADGSDSRRAG
jgi:acyl carrier protein